MSPPTTPKKQRDCGYVPSSPSLIPSPRNTSQSPKYQPRAEDPEENRLRVLNPVDTNQLINHTKQHQHKEPQSHMTHFYRENVRQLSYLQDTFMLKKQKLDLVRDEMVSTRSKVDVLEQKLERLKEERRSKEQQVLLKENELRSLCDDSETKKKFMLQGHDLQLQQVRAKKESELNQLDSSYRTKWDKLKFMKIQKYEIEKSSTLEKISNLRSNISDNEESLQKILQDSESKYRELREMWLRNFQDDWKRTAGENESISKDIDALNKRINDDLEPNVVKEKTAVEELHATLSNLRQQLEATKAADVTLMAETVALANELTKVQQTRKDLGEYISNSQIETKQIKEILVKEETMRRKLHNELQELRGNIRVYCRVRPPLLNEPQDMSHILIEKFNEAKGAQSLTINRNEGRILSYNFQFDMIFEPSHTNKEIFEEIRQLVQSSLDGYNVCIFAYGQTGSGKTYTMLNAGDGMIPMTLSHIFKWTANLKERGWNYEMECEYIEIYNETILDLLRDFKSHDNIDEILDSQKHDIRHDHEKQGTYITNVTRMKMTSTSQVDTILKKASKMRSTAATRSNERSSRSHSVFMVHINGRNLHTGETSQGKLNLVDLAGSERINSSAVTGERLRETQNINKSLSCLGDVIYALNTPDAGKRYIPFRNSKLTYLLQYSLVGDSKTLMFVNIPPDPNHISETLNSLRFASKVNSTKIAKR
ncbi:AGR253Wp [Eremothecium gossypii ATCC 10895]|uniref:Kinesin-like protein n=1 Tax=Eremothecium gossypii (strain ATCC 10895 / CBS 109.51 / FGSC 9923 / NRRL Y-1056) TaxID=284811 RepID=Q74ZE6_EREGS|nr:AGR253Wp [Eremothecium gossypii ATCC 10895]AAS54743.1 AGR253Wp [Eremothecium gossypii ATCC 10895]AEY99074.1 FAGR253Wp [Eremothecium gossypii FDAG1]